MADGGEPAAPAARQARQDRRIMIAALILLVLTAAKHGARAIRGDFGGPRGASAPIAGSLAIGPGPVYRVRINRDPPDRLRLLPGVGPARARALVSHRERYGPFRSVEDIGRVRGFGPATVSAIEDYLDYSEDCP